MRKALIPAIVLVVAAIVLGSTVFREQIARAATSTPFQQVLVQNTNTNPVPVTQVGTSTTSVSGAVGIDPNKNTVKLDPNGNTRPATDVPTRTDPSGELPQARGLSP